MSQFRLLAIPIEDYNALHLTSDSVLQTYFNDSGELVVRAVDEDDLEDYECDFECETCPMAFRECDSDCTNCPCYAPINGEPGQKQRVCRYNIF